jgi:hypothetical protein
VSDVKINFDTLIGVVENHAKKYEGALNDLQKSASDGVTANSTGTFGISAATVATTNVQVTQSLTEMASGIAKNAADHTKGLGRKISGG